MFSQCDTCLKHSDRKGKDADVEEATFECLKDQVRTATRVNDVPSEGTLHTQEVRMSLY